MRYMINTTKIAPTSERGPHDHNFILNLFRLVER